MGVENNECVVATTWDHKSIDKVRGWISNLPKEQQGLFVFADSIVNYKVTVFMAPDGSKKGWNTANMFEQVRDDFIEFLESFKYDDGSSPFDYVEVGYGEYGQKVLRGNCENKYNDNDYAV